MYHSPHLFAGKSGDKDKIDSVTITPDPPVKGKSVEIKATVTFGKCLNLHYLGHRDMSVSYFCRSHCAEEEVTGGKIEVEAKYGIIPIYSGTLDLCATVGEIGLSCPIASGDRTLSTNQTIPSVVPSVSLLKL